MRPLSFLLFLSISAWAQQPGGMSFPNCVDGLERLDEGDWKGADEEFTKAIERDVANPNAFLARAVARALAERLPVAQEDVEQAFRLAPEDAETRCWEWTIGSMAGRAWKDSPPAPKGAYETWLRELASDYANGGDARIGAVAQFRDAGAWFVHRAKDEVRIAPLLFQRASDQYDAKEYAKARENLGHVLEANRREANRKDPMAVAPPDATLLLHRANCSVALGDWYSARGDLTRVLTLHPDNARAYLARALVEAKLGNAVRAHADLEIASKTFPQDAETRRAEVEEALAGAGKETWETTEAKVDAVRKAAADPASPADRLVELALAVHRSTNAWWPDVDETTQDSVRKSWEKGEDISGEPAIFFPNTESCPSDPAIYPRDTQPQDLPGPTPAEAEASLRVALAIDEARARLSGTTLAAGGQGRLTVPECGFTFHTRVALASMLGGDRKDEAIALLEATVALAGRLAVWDLYDDAKGPPLAQEVAKITRRIAELHGGK